MNSVVEWRKGVLEHYGSLQSFSHTSTVEFMLTLISRDITNELQMRGWLKADPVELERWVKGTESDHQQYLEIQKELTEWLTLKAQQTAPCVSPCSPVKLLG